MKCIFRIVIICVAVGVATAEAGEGDGFVTDLGQGWRLTVGSQFNFNAKGRLGVKSRAMPVPASVYSSSRAAAQAAGDAIFVGIGRADLPNGAYIDPSDAAGISGETWNWRVPSGQLNGGTMSFANRYAERSTVYETSNGGYAKDDAYSAGANFGIDRTVWTRGDFGVDVGFNFSFFIKDNWFKGTSGGYVRTDTYTEGTYNTDVNLGNAAVFSDPWAQNPDGSYGSGTYDGPGPVLNLSEVSIAHRWGAEQTRTETTSCGSFSVRGDLQMYEFQFALKPYYKLTDWFMLRGTMGVGLDYRNFDARIPGLGKDSEHDWDCYMICGLGGMFYWKDFCIGADFLHKVFDDDMDVNTRHVNGTVGNASWISRIYVGYEF